MALTVSFDYPAKIVSEPGFHQRWGSEQIAAFSVPSQRNIWVDPIFSTVMLKPLQLDPTWLGTTNQLPYVIRLTDFTVDASDLGNSRIVERSMGGDDEPWIWYWPVGPSPLFPGVAPHPAPGTPPSVTGITVPTDIADIDVTSFLPHTLYEPSTVLPAPGVNPAPVVAGGYSSSKTIAETKVRYAANQPFFFRWKHSGGPRPLSQNTFIIFYVGQFALYVRDVTLQVWEDTSPCGDRSVGQKVLGYPLWGYANEAEQRRSAETNRTAPWNLETHDRWLLWLPFRRNKVLLLANTGRAHFLTTRPDSEINRNAAATDWINVRSDTLRVKVFAPDGWGRFQIQRVAFATPGTVDGPITRLAYTPAVSPFVTVNYDADGGSSLTATRSHPPAYSLPKKKADDCPDDATGVPSAVGSSWGEQFTLTADSSKTFSPFLYSFDVDAPRVYINNPVAQLDVPDSGSASKLVNLRFSLGEKPGSGRGELRIHDVDPYPVAGRYYRGSVPFKVTEGAATLFTGYTQPMEVRPYLPDPAPRAVTVAFLDGWKELEKHYFTEEKDYTGVGHITAVLEVANRAGIEGTGAETPPINTPALDRQWNTKLSDFQTLEILGKNVKSPWTTKVSENAAQFIRRVAGLWSGWRVGFRADGTFWYLPENYFTTVSKRFYASVAQATVAGNPTAPVYHPEVRFHAREPEANVILVRSGSANSGEVRVSPLYVDWASIKTPARPNYLGEWRPEVVDVGGGFSCRHLDWIARRIWDQTRRRLRLIEAEADYQSDVAVGHLVEFNPYGNYRIESIRTNHQAIHDRRVTYEAVLDEAGY